ncbi:hypothetical protein BDW74DRAFT_188511 [Aspergillus multicolor]|uniref:phosphotransferase family protein n=1 Tax=Aspergillus multicolor TaxID=41759 RepID=UPI003CCD6089
MLLLSRTLRNTHRKQFVAHLSILCRGKPISREELFRYTNGRFFVSQEYQLERRYRKFNLDALCDVAAAVGQSTSPIKTVEKFEGGFSKALLMTKEGGEEAVAKIPCRIAGPAFFTTAAEVGILEYIRNHTIDPVPRVLSWSPDDANPVGAEYIIMEKAPGVPPFQEWGDMAEYHKLELIKGLTKLEAQLSPTSFPAYGGLYLQSDARGLGHQEIEGSEFCVGPSPDRSFGGSSIAGSVEQGPLMKLLDTNPMISKFAQPTLWHTDLHMGNILIDPGKKSKITACKDVQSISVLPFFLQTCSPVSLKPPPDYAYPKGFVQPSPTPPPNLNTLSDEEKHAAEQEWMAAKMAKAYEVSTFLENRRAYHALHAPRVFRELFMRLGEVAAVGIVPLRECLIEVFCGWTELGFEGACPYSFAAGEIEAHEREFEQYAQ